MDIVLETFDNLILDKAYARIVPKNAQIPPILEKLLMVQKLPQLVSNIPLDTNSTIDQVTDIWHRVPASEIYGQIPFFFETSSYASKSLLPRDNIMRQFISLTILTSILGIALYLTTAWFSYVFFFDKEIFKHPKYKKNQMAMEIKQAVFAIPFMSIFAAFCFTFEIRGYSKLYWKLDEYPAWYFLGQVAAFFLFTDLGVYIAHRGLHHPKVYKYLHKTHHKWIVSTPFASHAFHPMDGFIQSIPYHMFPFIFPVQKAIYLCLFMIINVGTVLIHDGNFFMNNGIIHGTACHAVHHLYFNYNYGQYTTLWDRLGGSYRKPEDELFQTTFKQDDKTWQKQSEKIDKILLEVDGDEEVTSSEK